MNHGAGPTHSLDALRAPADGGRAEIRPLETTADYAACVALQELIWGKGFNERVPGEILRLSQRVGGIASGAFAADGALLGFVFGMTGLIDDRVTHWSDMLAVHPAARDRGIGEALKRHQRELLLSRGITLVQWTFDPLEARNAWLNFARLGAIARAYVRDFYSESDSPLHAGMPTDRLIVEWWLDDRRVIERLEHRSHPPSYDSLAGAQFINSPRPGGDALAATPADLDFEHALPDPDADRLVLAVPPRIQELKAADPALAMRWRMITRAVLEMYLPRGYSVTDAVRGDGWTGLLLDRV
ncbi:MAG: hypothetical protein L0271_19780 [Gemmatimonadetes bacterium]|nr:hypothetical protein [Gemmatimonadota bacterium]